MKKYFYPVIFQPEDEGFSAFVPDMPGCMTQGDTMEETLDMLQDAMGLMLEDVAEKDYPQPSKPQSIKVNGGQFVMMAAFDKLAYDRKYNSKSVKKTLSIPRWLDTMAKEHNINFSNTLQNALCKELNVSFS